MPVAMAKTLGSKIMSSGGNPTSSTSKRYAMEQISMRRCRLSAWPCSSNAMTTTAAPYLRHRRACCRKGSTPSFMEMELTMDLPCTQRRSSEEHKTELQSLMLNSYD